MSDISTNFGGDIPAHYEKYLGDFLFEPYAIDLATRVNVSSTANVLELACGTGRLTQQLLSELPKEVLLTATDINPDMLKLAQEKVLGPNVFWETVDISELPYEDERFDLVICQFGLMFVPEKVKALQGIRRVLKKSGRLIFNTWGNMSDIPAFEITNTVLANYFSDPILTKETGPFAMADDKVVLSMLAEADFNLVFADKLELVGESRTSTDAAKGILMGTPVYSAIMKANPQLLPQILDSLSEALVQHLGDGPLRSVLSAFVFEAVK